MKNYFKQMPASLLVMLSSGESLSFRNMSFKLQVLPINHKLPQQLVCFVSNLLPASYLAHEARFRAFLMNCQYAHPNSSITLTQLIQKQQHSCISVPKKTGFTTRIESVMQKCKETDNCLVIVILPSHPKYVK